MNSGLSERHERFAREYVIDLNATQAYIRAGYKARGNAAEVNAARLLRNAQVQLFVAALQRDRNQAMELTHERVLREVARLAFVDIRKAFNADGGLKLPHEMDDDTAAAISGIDTLTTSVGGGDEEAPMSLVTKKVKVFDKKGALELAMRHMGLLNDKMHLTGGVTASVEYIANMPPRGAAAG